MLDAAIEANPLAVDFDRVAVDDGRNADQRFGNRSP